MVGGRSGCRGKLAVGKVLQKGMELHRSLVLASESCHLRALWVAQFGGPGCQWDVPKTSAIVSKIAKRLSARGIVS